jgi:hypothetical protein
MLCGSYGREQTCSTERLVNALRQCVRIGTFTYYTEKRAKWLRKKPKKSENVFPGGGYW